ncbi:MAG: hypothetical protein JXR97_03045 [Planctomycetes bacterium]|nr:hypothetical protein [Planctomycetota bacterium]
MATKEEPFESTMRLRKSLFIYLATALFTLTLALMVVIFIILFGHLKNAEDQSLCHNAQIRAMAVMEWNRRAKDLARQITSRTSIRQALEKYNRGEESLAELKKFTIPRLKDAMNLSEDICGIMRLDTKNNRVAECGDCPRCAVAVEDLGVL